MDTIDLVIGAHHAAGIRLCNRNLERLHVHLIEGALRHVRGAEVAERLLVIGNIVLEGSNDLVGLNALNVGGSHHARQIGVFAVVFKATAAQRVTGQVKTRAIELVGTESAGFLTSYASL